MFDFGTITNWLDALLNSVMPGWLATCVEGVLVMVILVSADGPIMWQR